MKKSKITIFNDREIPMLLKLDARHEHADIWLTDTVKPASYRTVEIEVPDGCQLFVKIWEDNTAMVSFVPGDSL